MNATMGPTLVMSALLLWASPAAAQTSERASDKEIKELIQKVDEGRDKFEGNLDGRFKGSTLKTPRGDVKVSGALQDYQDSTQKLMNRFTPEYAANSEVATVLTQSMAIDRFMQGQPTSMKGRAEWNTQLAFIKRLADAYATTFPVPDGATPRRDSDKEVVAAADAVAKGADRMKDPIGDHKTLPKAEKDAAKKDVELLVKQAETVASKTRDAKPASADVRQLMAQAAKLEAFLTAQSIPNAGWQSVKSSVAKLQQAFRLTP